MKRSPITLDGATALVTGAGSGIGRATAHALAARGSTVLCTDIDETAAEKTAAECAERTSSPNGPAHHAYRLDVADRQNIKELAQEVELQHGPLTVLINNAGIGMTGPFAAMTSDEWASIRSINLDGVVECCLAFTPPMLATRRGHVVNVSSGLAYVATATESAYAATKAAVLQLSFCQRAEWAAHHVGVSAVCPGFVNTEIARSTRFTGGHEDAAARAKLVKGFSRAHPPEKVGQAVVDAIVRNRAVVPVGFESVAAWYAHRLAPIALQQTLARLSGKGRG